MAQSLDALKKSAAESARSRGHILEPWTAYKSHSGAFTCCRACGFEVEVLGDPAPNEIDIGGRAVALFCNP